MKHTFSATTLALALASFTANADDWTQYRGPNNDGSSSEKLPTKNFGKQPRALWKTDTYPLGFSSFVTEGNTAFTVCARGGKEVLVAVNANNGKQLWSFNIGDTDYGNGGGNAGARNNSGGDGPRSTPSVVDGKVYATSANMGLYCLDAKSGKQLWSHDLLKEFNGVNIKWENAASPLIDGDLVFMAGGGKGQALLAFNKNSGKVAWKTGDDVMTHSTPVVASSAGYGVGSAAVRIGPGFKVDELWRIHGHKDVANHWSTPVYKDGHLYGMFSFKKYGDGPLKCVELATGKVVWEKEGFGPGNCILIDGSLLALSDDGHVVLAEADSKAYREQSRFKAVSGKCWTTPILANGRIYVRSTTEAACFDVSGRTARR